jgi:aspartyl/asparaginyl beta-hydroxylase (cupin superfamily)
VCQACALLRTLRHGVGLPLIRVGYSAIGAHGRLRPHYGMTNGQLKLHLGLVVPSEPSATCAWFRVGNETRHGAWREGGAGVFVS